MGSRSSHRVQALKVSRWGLIWPWHDLSSQLRIEQAAMERLQAANRRLQDELLAQVRAHPFFAPLRLNYSFI
jgi:hypothetical protein